MKNVPKKEALGKAAASAMVSKQLRDEGAVDEIVALANKLAAGQFKTPTDDKKGAMKLMMDALARQMVAAPSRPECCEAHERQWLEAMMMASLCSYEQERVNVAKRDRGGGNVFA